jgi:osmotically inducible protein OsmC
MPTPEDITRSASAHWEGDVSRGKGQFKTETGIVSAGYSFNTRFSNEPGTNPEELIAAAHAACFSMALSAELTRAGHPPSVIDTVARVHVGRDGAGFAISGIDLETSAEVPGLDPATFEGIAGAAKAGCPVSKALAAVPISLAARLR